MCGISGIYSFHNHSVDRASLERMNRALSHRGPEGEGYYVKGAIGLGHRRLKIIDLSDRAQQPFVSENGKIRLVCNGEIYNYRYLQDELKNRGHVFTSQSDNEVILHGYEEWGLDVLSKLEGMWAFAIWDDTHQKLILARDRIGKRPLVYYHDREKFIFASELNSLLTSRMIPDEISHDALVQYFTLSYIPHPLTIYRNVFKLPPAHYLVCENQSVSIKSYWRYSWHKNTKKNKNNWSELDRILHESVRKRLVSDVPVGVFLSGGLDSSLIVAIASRYIQKGDLKTFSIGFEEEAFNELPYARDVAQLYQTQHHEFIVRPDVHADLKQIQNNYGEPYADESAIPSYYLAKMASSKIKVAINGDGGDECFVGYNRYFFPRLSIYYQHLPIFLKAMLRNIIHGVCRESSRPSTLSQKIRHVFDFGFDRLERRYYQTGIFNKCFREQFFSFSVSHIQDVVVELYRQRKTDENLSTMDALLNFDYLTYLTDNLMVKMDIACMAHSLEVRSPLLDPELFNFMNSIPFSHRARTQKYYLKTLALKKNYLPRSIVLREKQGFSVPVGAWMKRELKDYLVDKIILSHSSLENYFDPTCVKQMVQEHLCSKRDHSKRLWTLVCFLIWHDHRESA